MTARAHGIESGPVYEVRAARPGGEVLARVEVHSLLAARECRDLLLIRWPGVIVTVARCSSVRR